MPQNPSPTSGTLTRRSVLAVAPLTALAACGRAPATGYPGFALVTLAGENSLAVIDLNTFRTVRKHHFQAAPSSIVGYASTAYALTPANGTIHVIRPDSPLGNHSARLSTELDLVRLMPQGDKLIAVSSSARDLLIASAAELKPIRRTRLLSAPIDLDINTNSFNRRTYVAVSGGSSGLVETVDVDSGEHRIRQLEGELGVLRFRSDGQMLFVANYGRQSLMALDTQSLKVVCELPLPMRPENLTFGADGGQLFISGGGMDGISIVYTYKTIEVDQTVFAAKEPGCMACSSNPRYLFVASRAGSEIAILNVDSRKMVALSLGGSGASRIVITPDQQYALILNQASGDLAIIRIPEIRNSHSRRGNTSMPSQIVTLRGVSLFAMLPIGDKPVDIALTDRTA